MKQSIAKGVVVTGLAIGFGSWGADVMTCPGVVETGGGDFRVSVCDENPDSDDLFNNPGTPEQKLMYAGFLLAGLGGAALWLASRQSTLEQTNPELAQSTEVAP